MQITKNLQDQLISQINKAFQTHSDKLLQLEGQIQKIQEELSSEQRPKTRKTRGKRVQQTEANSEASNKEVCGASQEG